jgi:sensor domain CHASE-containing protein
VAILQANKPSVRGRRPWLLPALVCLALLALTTAVWRQQVQHQRELWTRHTADVCVQASRRLEVLVGARLTVAQTFARRWANHEHSDFSRDRFTEFARAILAELPDYRAVALVRRKLPLARARSEPRVFLLSRARSRALAGRSAPARPPRHRQSG